MGAILGSAPRLRRLCSSRLNDREDSSAIMSVLPVPSAILSERTFNLLNSCGPQTAGLRREAPMGLLDVPCVIWKPKAAWVHELS